ncbi:MAG: methyltransferase, partial [Pseudomonadota bacterium]
ASAIRLRWLSIRDRLLADPRFQSWAAATPFTRPLARRRARELYDVVAGFVYSQVLFACVQIRLFDRLADGPKSLAELAAAADLEPGAMGRLLSAAESLRLVSRRGAGADGAALYGLGELGAALNGAPGVKEMVSHHALFYADLADPLALLRAAPDGTGAETRLNAYWSYAGEGESAALADGQVADYSALMAASQPLVAEEILEAFPVARHRRLLDIGGGTGAFARAVAARAPEIDITVFDLPAVAARANAGFAAEGLSGRARAVGGSFFDDPLPEGRDLVTLVRVIYDHQDAAAMRILRAARAATPPGGALLLAEPMADTPGAAPIGAAYFSFYLLAMGGGRSRSAQRLSEMAREAGFSEVRLLPARRPILTRVLLARP